MSSAHCSIEKEIATKKVNSLTLFSMMQDCYHYCTARTRWAHAVTLQWSPQRHHCWPFWVLSRNSGEGDHGLTLSSTRTAVLLLQHVCTRTVWHHSHSQPRHQLTSQFKAGQQINLVMTQVNWLLSRLTSFKASFKTSQVVNWAITYNVCTSIGKWIELIILYFHRVEILHYIMLHIVVIFKLSTYLFRMELPLLSVIM